MTNPGYAIGRDDHGLTARERQVMSLLAGGSTLVQIGSAIGVTKQRVNQIVKALEAKGRVRRSRDTIEIVVPRTLDRPEAPPPD